MYLTSSLVCIEIQTLQLTLHIVLGISSVYIDICIENINCLDSKHRLFQ